MRLGILGGTFDPVHLGHLILAETAREELALDKVLFVPAGQPWRKVGREITPVEHRVAMVRLAVGDNPHFSVSTIETETAGPSYTIATLERIKAEQPVAELFFIVGADAYDDMPNWRQPEKILELATVVLAARTAVPAERRPEREIAGLQEKMYVLDNRLIEISGTEIRQRVAGGKSIRYLVPFAVEKYIGEHRLYLIA